MHTFDYERVKDPAYFCDGRLDPHSDHMYFASWEELASLREGEKKDSTFRESLNGLWKFHYADSCKETVPGFEQPDFDCRGWADIRVPAHIQLEGYDRPQYTNTQYPWEGHEEIQPGEIPTRFNPTASYVRYFTVPERMRGSRIFISFQGVESALALWLNGVFIGYSEDSFTPSEFELTDQITDGENKLAVQVFKWTSASWCEDQDFFRFSGIFREVYLYTIPRLHIRDLQVLAIPQEDLRTAELSALLTMEPGEISGTVEVDLRYRNHTVKKEEAALLEKTGLVLRIKDPVLWSAEDPVLYDLILAVRDRDGALTEVVWQKVGFRRFEMKDHQMFLNGRRIVFKGVNRHEFSAISGRCVSEAMLRKDLATMKKNNINAIRTCHYPNTSLFYRLCDEYGLYVVDETNLESHGTWDVAAKSGDFSSIVPCDRPEWQGALLDRANSVYQRDKNHPCVLIWSCGNESFGGRDIYEMSQLFRKLDPTRLVHYEGVSADRRYKDTSDMESRMYLPAKEIRDFLSGHRDKPFLSCEYAHAMGNSVGALHEYTELTRTEPLYQGGFIWDYIDQALLTKDRYGRDYLAYGGDFGDRPTDYNFSGNGLVYADTREPSPKMQEVKFQYQGIRVQVGRKDVLLENENLFTGTEAYECRIRVDRDGHPIRQTVMETHTKPLTKDRYPLPLPEESEPGEYALTVSFHLKEDTIWADRGYEVAFGQYVYRIEGGAAPAHPKLTVIHSNHDIGVRGENFEAIFSYLYGGLTSYIYGGKELIRMIPKPNFWRAPTDNDIGSQMPARYAQWKIASLYLSDRRPGQILYESDPPKIQEDADSLTVTYTYGMPTTPPSQCKAAYQVYGDGRMRVTLTYDPVQELSDMPEFGFLFKLDAQYDHVLWYGLGYEETYADRKMGAKLGIYENRVKDNMARYLVPQECGNKEEVRYAEVTDALGRGLRVEMTRENGPFSFSALPYTPHELENASHAYELPGIYSTVVRVSKGQMGVGGDDSWGARTHPEYLLDAEKEMKFSFLFRGI